MELISKNEIKQFLKLNNSKKSKTTDFIYNKLKLKELNDIYKRHRNKNSSQFVQDILNELGITLEIQESDLKRIPKEGGFILLSNHPFGALDGLVICKTISEKRSDFKLMGNFLLQRVEPLKELIFPVNPFETMKDKKSSVKGVRQSLTYLEEGHPIGIFPAGEVAAFNFSKMNVVEKEWDQIVKFILKANVPVIPTFISGTNSPLFHALGLIHPLLRTAKLPSELFNKKNKKVTLKIGHPISVSELQKMDSTKEIAQYLKLKSNNLSNSIKIEPFFKKPLLGIQKKVSEIIPPIKKELLNNEINSLSESHLITKINEYQLFLIQSYECPNLMLELGRKREETFRLVGEGTNKELDLDPFDVYYNHLIIWDSNENELVGSYRIGKGDEIIERFGMDGFYLSTLFTLNKKLTLTLRKSVELGRSFIAEPYQRKPTTLLLLWKGILLFMEQNPRYNFLIGPVSISNDYSKNSKKSIISFSEMYLNENKIEKFIKPKKKFKSNPFSGEKVDKLVQRTHGDIDKLDQLIQESDNGKKLPILLKKYIGLNAKIVAFNVDKKFNNCLDGFLFLEFHKITSELKERIK